MGLSFLVCCLLGYGFGDTRAPMNFKPVDPGDPSFPALGDYLAILERFPLYAERGWHGGYQGDSALGYFGDGRSDENGQRTLGNFILVYAYLATRPDYDPTVSSVPPATLKERALAALRYMVRTHITGDLKCTDGRPWGNHWQSAWWASRMLGGATLLWDALSEEERSRIQRLVVYEADRHIGLPPRVNEYGDTKAEENAWDSEILAWALNLYPDHPHVPGWREAFVRLCLNTLSVEADLQDERLIEGKPLKEWVGGPCIHPDFTIENHGFFHICYMACPLHSLAWDYYVFRRFGRKPPEAIFHHVREVWGRLKQFFLWRGRFAYVGGKDWPRYAYGLYFILPALVQMQQVFGDGDARLIERWRVATFEREQRLHGDGSFFSGRFTQGQMSRWPAEWETDAAANLTIAALLHEFQQPPLPPTPLEEWSRRQVGTFISPFSELAMRRDERRFVSWCWKSHGGPATGLICSDAGEDMLEWDHNLCGSIVLEGTARHVAVVAHHEEAFEGGFSTTGLMEHGLLKGEPSPYRLVVVDDNVPTATIEAKEHPLFTTPHPIASLQGLIDLDSIVEAGPGWRVLARNARGGPSILEARIGRGIFLLSMTNMEERCVQGDATARALMENLLAYVRARERRCGYVRGESHLRQALEALGLSFKTLNPRRLDLAAVDVLFIDRSAREVQPLYPQLLAFVQRGGILVHSIVQDVGWEPDAIVERRPTAVQQFLSWSALPDGRTAVLIGLWKAAGRVSVSSLDLLDWRVANDIFNGKRRQIWSEDARRPHVVLQGLDGKGEEIPLRSPWLNLEGDVGLVAWAPQAHFRILDIPERRAPARSLCFAQVQMVLENLPRRFALGETIARGIFVFRTRVSPEETKAMASSLEVPQWEGERVSLRVPGADGRGYLVVANFSPDGLTTKVTSP